MFSKKIGRKTKKPQYFYVGSNWLWEAMKYNINPETKKLPSTVEQHMDLVNKYLDVTKRKLKPSINDLLKNHPESKLITDASAWRLSGANVMLRNHASDILDNLLAPFWNNRETLKNLAFYEGVSKPP